MHANVRGKIGLFIYFEASSRRGEIGDGDDEDDIEICLKHKFMIRINSRNIFNYFLWKLSQRYFSGVWLLHSVLKCLIFGQLYFLNGNDHHLKLIKLQRFILLSLELH